MDPAAFELEPCSRAWKCGRCRTLTLGQMFACIWTCGATITMLFISHHGSCDGRLEDFVIVSIFMLAGPAIAAILLHKAHSPTRRLDVVIAICTMLVGFWLSWWFSYVTFRSYDPYRTHGECRWTQAALDVSSRHGLRDARPVHQK